MKKATITRYYLCGDEIPNSGLLSVEIRREEDVNEIEEYSTNKCPNCSTYLCQHSSDFEPIDNNYDIITATYKCTRCGYKVTEEFLRPDIATKKFYDLVSFLLDKISPSETLQILIERHGFSELWELMLERKRVEED